MSSETRTPLVAAIQCQNYGVIDVLLQAGLDINAYKEDSITPLVAAIDGGDHALMRRLLDLGASPTMKVFQYGCYNVLHMAREPEAVDILLDYGAGVDDPCDFCPTALWRNVMEENRGGILHLISKGADVNSLNSEGETPLQHAQQLHLDDIAELLEKLGGTRVSANAQRAAQITSVINLASQFKLVSTEEPCRISYRRWVTLGRGLFLLEDYQNSIIAMEMVFHISDGAICTEFNCGGCGSCASGRYHLCRETGFGYCHSWCFKMHEREVNRVSSVKDHIYVTYPRPYFDEIPSGFVAIDETPHVSRNEWLDQVLAKWQSEQTAPV